MGILVRDIAGSAAAARSGPAAIPAGDTLIIWSRTPPAVDATPMDRLSLRCAFGGRFAQRLGDRRLVVDDDAYLVVNAGESCAADRVEGSAAHLLTVCFSEPRYARQSGQASRCLLISRHCGESIDWSRLSQMCRYTSAQFFMYVSPGQPCTA